jgi:hypothetical protein
MPECRKKVCQASAFLPVFNCYSPASGSVRWSRISPALPSYVYYPPRYWKQSFSEVETAPPCTNCTVYSTVNGHWPRARDYYIISRHISCLQYCQLSVCKKRISAFAVIKIGSTPMDQFFLRDSLYGGRGPLT